MPKEYKALVAAIIALALAVACIVIFLPAPTQAAPQAAESASTSPEPVRMEPKPHYELVIETPAPTPEIAPEQTPEPTPCPYTDEELDMIAATVYGEAPYCSDEHQAYVAQVLLNRVADERFPDNVYDNLVAPMQYHTRYTEAWYIDAAKATDEWERCYAAALRAVNGNTDMPETVIYQDNAAHGHTVWKIIYVDTGWFRSTTYFCEG